ncbi:MAG: DUF177 domain-containing protein [Calditrichaeota bacterium]|nr:DUF177 domain-containing protein [Calditrichota bacterium]MCB0270323.1 DUF177 domain-containing protein [Calditrichota bacterium]MCB0285785.1 DUF177 domain-containing protein [Calditrichota bacterium]MCB0301585.1 DUF177 domain-containing protein [Calditrichota bacterium]MCB9068499.1 DUF177 domain-containing protein [Calditrichia bacterium]
MKLPILHLQDGIHHFSESVLLDALDFFRKELYPNPVKTNVMLNKYGNTIQAEITAETTAVYICDRCLTEYEKPVNIEFSMLIQIGENAVETDEENVIHLPKDTAELSITDWLVEYLIINTPMKMLCDEDCKGICAGCGANLNTEPCSCSNDGIDPRWEKLGALRK